MLLYLHWGATWVLRRSELSQSVFSCILLIGIDCFMASVELCDWSVCLRCEGMLARRCVSNHVVCENSELEVWALAVPSSEADQSRLASDQLLALCQRCGSYVKGKSKDILVPRRT